MTNYKRVLCDDEVDTAGEQFSSNDLEESDR